MQEDKNAPARQTGTYLENNKRKKKGKITLAAGSKYGGVNMTNDAPVIGLPAGGKRGN